MERKHIYDQWTYKKMLILISNEENVNQHTRLNIYGKKSRSQIVQKYREKTNSYLYNIQVMEVLGWYNFFREQFEYSYILWFCNSTPRYILKSKSHEICTVHNSQKLGKIPIATDTIMSKYAVVPSNSGMEQQWK